MSSLGAMRGLVNEEKAKEFDELHARAATPKRGKNNKGAKELAGGYTRGNRWNGQVLKWEEHRWSI